MNRRAKHEKRRTTTLRNRRTRGTSLVHIPLRAADAKRSALLDVEEGAACLAIERRTWSSDAPITYVRLTYPGEGHELVARFSPSQR